MRRDVVVAFELSLIAGCLLAAALGRPARACSPPACGSGRVIPVEGSVVPASVPALLYIPYFREGSPPVDASGFRLLDDTGRAVDVTITASGGTFLVAPRVSLIAGRRYRVQYPQTCTAALPTQIGSAEQSFTAGPATALPTTTGTVAAVHYRTGPRRVWSGKSPGLCSDSSEVIAAVARVEIDPSPELRALLPISHIRVRAGTTEVAALAQPQLAPSAPLSFEVFTTCITDDRFAAPGLPVGTHRLEILTETFGVPAAPAPLSVEVTLDCAAAADGGAPEAGADASAETGPMDTGGADAGAAEAAADTPGIDAATDESTSGRPDTGADTASPSRSSGSGCDCALVSRPGGSDGRSLALLPLLALWLGRRARRRRRAG
jgi:hypothetical protein